MAAVDADRRPGADVLPYPAAGTSGDHVKRGGDTGFSARECRTTVAGRVGSLFRRGGLHSGLAKGVRNIVVAVPVAARFRDSTMPS